VQVTRNVYDPSSKDFKIASEILEVPIKPGWKAGTRITYAGQAGTCLIYTALTCMLLLQTMFQTT